MKLSTLKSHVCFSFVLIILVAGVDQASRKSTIRYSDRCLDYRPNHADPGGQYQTELFRDFRNLAVRGRAPCDLHHAGGIPMTAKIGYSEAVYGMGKRPTDVVIDGYITPNYSGNVSTNMTTVFWRSMANLALNPARNVSQNNPPNTLQWGVSQGTSLRRLQINGNLQLDGWY